MRKSAHTGRCGPALCLGAALLLCARTAALQPPPVAQHRRVAAGPTTRRHSRADTVGVFACDGTAGDQAFTLNASSGALQLADGRCLLRSDAGVTAGACDGTGSVWTVVPCTARGCDGATQSWVRSGAADGLVLGLPGAHGPWVDVWTPDDPTGSCHNELWRAVATGGAGVTVRTLCNNSAAGACPGVDLLDSCLTVVPPPLPPPPCTLTPRAACHAGTWDAPPHSTPSNGVVDGPLLGNGDLGAVLAVGREGGLEWWLGKADLYSTNTAVDEPVPALHADGFYTALGAGAVAFAPAAAGAAGAFSARQELVNASVWARLARTATAPGFAITSATIAADLNVMTMTLRVDSSSSSSSSSGGGGSSGSSSSSSSVLFTLTLSQATVYALPIDANASADGGALWSSKGGVRAVDNSMLLMPCDTRSYVIHPSISTFTSDAVTGRLAVANGSAALLCPRRVGPTKLSIGPCDDASGQSDWRLVPARSGGGAPPGALQLALAGAAACAWATAPAYHNSGGTVTVGPCDAQVDAWWTWRGDGQLRSANVATQCLTAVPHNVNVTIGVAARVVRAADGAPVPLVAPARAGGGAGATTVSVQAGVLLQTDTDYLVIVSAATSHDGAPTAAAAAAAAAAPHAALLAGALAAPDPVDAALALAGACVGAPGLAFVAARHAASAAWWTAYWRASALYLGEARQLLEGFYYGAQYLLGSTTRAGKVVPGLWGVWAVLDSNGWNGDLTIDYNAQANFYGSCSSNRCDQLQPYMDTIGSDWHLEVSRQRAAANWSVKGSAGGPGQTSQSMCCGYMDHAYEDPHICPPSAPGGYAGIEMTSHIGPYPGLYYFSDLSLRVIAAMSILPFVDYGEYTGDEAWINSTAYPLAAAVADFWVSYATPNAATGVMDLLNTCAQEICGGGPASEDNAHHTIAYTRAVLAVLLRWSAALGRDADKRPAWRALLDGLPPLPLGTYGGNAVWLEANATQANFLSNAHAYSIVYTAALHPADVVGLSSPADVLAAAWATVAAVASVSHWHPLNGLCMAWGPATRCAGTARAAAVLDGWEAALVATMFPNFYPQLDGGGIEQAGATEAVNSALLQSAEGFLRLFPMWPPGENASFATLRARGAVLVTAQWRAGGGVASPVVLEAASPGPCSVAFLDPWASGAAPPPWTPPVVTRAADGASVPLTPAPGAPPIPVWAFAAAAGETYELRPAAGGEAAPQ